MELHIFKPAKRFLDDYHKERETVLRICREITSSSKSIIFSTHRITGRKITSKIYGLIWVKFSLLSKSLQKLHQIYEKSVNYYQYKASISNAIEEMVEAFMFLYFVINEEILSFASFMGLVQCMVSSHQKNSNQILRCWVYGGNINIFDVKKVEIKFILLSDYIVGLFDLSGEIMRYSIVKISNPHINDQRNDDNDNDNDDDNESENDFDECNDKGAQNSLNEVINENDNSKSVEEVDSNSVSKADNGGNDKAKSIKEVLKYLNFMKSIEANFTKLLNQYPNFIVSKGLIDIGDDGQKGDSYSRKLMVLRQSTQKVEDAIIAMVIKGNELV